jgi:hypothetical protein
MIFSDLPSPAEAGFAKVGNQYPLFGIMLERLDALASRRAGQAGIGATARAAGIKMRSGGRPRKNLAAHHALSETFDLPCFLVLLEGRPGYI